MILNDLRKQNVLLCTMVSDFFITKQKPRYDICNGYAVPTQHLKNAPIMPKGQCIAQG